MVSTVYTVTGDTTQKKDFFATFQCARGMTVARVDIWWWWWEQE